MLKKETIITIIAILVIFVLGFTLRAGSIHLSGIPDNEKSFYKDQNDLPYMYEIDSYYNYRLTKNYLDHGYLGDTKINGREWDLHSYYPPGVPMDYPPLIVYITAFFYKLVNLFSNTSLLIVCFWIPVFIAPLCGIPAYFLVSRLTNAYGGLAAGFLAVMSPFYFTRSVPGWFDTDMFIILFSILVVLFFTEAIQSKNTRKRMIFAGLSAFSMFLFSMAWNGWQYLFYMLFFSSVFYILHGKLKDKNVENIYYTFAVFFLGSISLIWIFTGFLNIFKLVAGLFEFIKLIGTQNIWAPFPDLYISIFELGKPSANEIITQTNPILFGLGISGLFLSLGILIKNSLEKRLSNNIDRFFYIFLVLWTLSGFIALFKGARFIMLLIPPLTISTGITVGIFVDYLKTLKIKKNVKRFFYISIMLLLIVLPILNVPTSSKALIPAANDDLFNSAEWIKNNTSPNTVIISDWSFGHFFTATANRPVVFDGRSAYIETLPVRQFDKSPLTFEGKSPNTSRDYWINRAFSTSNESLSFGIFRMLSTSGDAAYLTLDEYTENTTKSVEILNRVLGVNKTVAKNILINDYDLNQKQAENILNYTHPDNPKPFVIVTHDKMIITGKWIFKFGNWDFNKVKESDSLYSVGNIKIHESFLNTSNDVFMDLKTGNVKWEDKSPYSSMIIKNGEVKKSYSDKKSSFCVVLLMDDEKAIVMNKTFENSIFMKLIVEKDNSTYFKSVYKNKRVTVWKATQY
ncbi:MAG: STT3 domain-containing protein [Methanobacterium sp.]|jgi:dolichyl-diphosphooligosaccharide--protein glycosyltransferase